MKNTVITGIIILVSVCTLFAKDIKGTVTNNSGETLPGVNVIVKNTTKGVQTDINGNYELKNVSENDILVFSYIGYKTKEIRASEDFKNIVLFEGNELLSEVVVTADRVNKFSRKQTAYVAKMPLKNIENSQVYSTITSDLLISQGVTNFSDALENAVGVQNLWESTGRNGDGAGYYTLRGFSVQPRLVNGVLSMTNGSVNPSSIERIEVIKGPSATLFGNVVSSYGGLINVVTKKPHQNFGGNVTLSAGSYDFYKGTVDINTPLNKDESIVFRLNAGLHSAKTWQDAGFSESQYVSPALSYKVNNKLTFNFNYEFFKSKQTNPLFLFINRDVKSSYNSIEELNIDYDKSFTNDEIYLENPLHNYRAEASYKFADNWESQTLISGSYTKAEGYYTYLYGVQDNLFGLFAQDTDAKTTTLNIQQNFIGEIKIGQTRNKILLGVDFEGGSIEDKSSNFARIHVVDPQANIIPVPPAYGFANVTLTKENLNKVLLNAPRSNTDVRQENIGVYISDVLEISPSLSLLAAVRYDRYNYKGDKNTSEDDLTEFKKSTFSPKFGVVYQPILDRLSIFANYQNGFSYVNPEVAVTDPNDPSSDRKLRSFDLEQANQTEIGIKSNFFSNRLEATLSFYNIKVTDKVMWYGFTKVQDGEVRTRGVEFEINTNPIKGLNVKAGVSYNDSEILKSEYAKDLVGKRMAESGAPWTYNFWADYKFSKNILKNVGLGFGFNGVSDYHTMVGYPEASDIILPAHTIYDASLYYDNHKFRVGINIHNLSDKEYFNGWGTINPQNPRNIMGTLSYKF